MEKCNEVEEEVIDTNASILYQTTLKAAVDMLKPMAPDDIVAAEAVATYAGTLFTAAMAIVPEVPVAPPPAPVAVATAPHAASTLPTEPPPEAYGLQPGAPVTTITEYAVGQICPKCQQGQLVEKVGKNRKKDGTYPRWLQCSLKTARKVGDEWVDEGCLLSPFDETFGPRGSLWLS